MYTNAGKNFRQALQLEKPLQIVGTMNAYTAMMAKSLGFKAIYLSGAGVSNFAYGLPDAGITSLDNVLEEVNRITSIVDLPLLVDIDTGWGNVYTIERAIKAMIRVNAAAVHLEDQVFSKRCGHLSGKQLVSTEEMVERIQAAVQAKGDSDFVIMARTDAFSVEGLEKTVKRALAYKEAGADMLFTESLTALEQYSTFKKAVNIPLLANITEFGKTPLFTTQQLSDADVDMVLYPLSVARAMNKAAYQTLEDIRKNGTQAASLPHMQTREELYKMLNYNP